jgi:hypothetical protein
MNYLQLTNSVLKRLNEVTVGTVSGQTGFQAYIAENAVLDAIDDIHNAELEWPFNFSSTSQAITSGVRTYALPSSYMTVDWESFYFSPKEKLTNNEFTSDITNWTNKSSGTGTIAHTSTGNGRMRLNAGASGTAAAEQSISTIQDNEYVLHIRFLGGNLTVLIGTTTGGSEIESQSYTLSKLGGVEYKELVFKATTATTFIGFSSTVNGNVDVDVIRVFRRAEPRKLIYMTIDQWARVYKPFETHISPESYGVPKYVYPELKDKFGLSPIPDDDEFEITYNHWNYPTRLSADSDIPNIPERYHHVIVDRATQYAYAFRENNDGYILMDRKFERGLRTMRTELINRPEYVTGDNSYFPAKSSLNVEFGLSR